MSLGGAKFVICSARIVDPYDCNATPNPSFTPKQNKQVSGAGKARASDGFVGFAAAPPAGHCARVRA